jgi:hypothetical protein
MSEPTSEQVDKVLNQLDDKPEWKSDAERLHLPLATVTSGSGAKVLDVDATLRRTTPNHAKEK